MSGEQETKSTEGNDEESSREKDANLMQKLLGNKDAETRKKFQNLDPIQKRDAEEQNQGQETENNT